MKKVAPILKSSVRRSWCLLALAWLLAAGVSTAATNGPLRPAIASQGENPRYFYDASDQPVYLTGSHTWDSVQDWGDHRPDFDFDAYLDLLEDNGHNFARLWLFEGPSTGDPVWSPRLHPLPWKLLSGGCRTSHGKHDGPVYELDTENLRPAFLTRLRDRVETARQRGIYVSVMLFQGWSVRQVCCGLDPWPSHPFRDGNNCLLDVTDGTELHSQSAPTAVWNVQRGLIEKVVEQLKDLDNVLWEVANESTTGSPGWQNQVVSTLRSIEQANVGNGYLRRPVGMTSVVPPSIATNDALATSSADWISPSHTCNGSVCGRPAVDCAALSLASGDDYVCDPPDVPNKVVLADTDHMVPLLASEQPADYRQWIWKSMTRGHNPIVMDAVQNPFSSNIETDPGHAKWGPIRRYLGEARAWANKLDLSRAVPRGDLCSTGFCLADPGREYLIYRPIGDMSEIEVEFEPGTYTVEWMTPSNGTSNDYGTMTVGTSGSVEVPTPVMGEVVVLVKGKLAEMVVHAPGGQGPISHRSSTIWLTGHPDFTYRSEGSVVNVGSSDLVVTDLHPDLPSDCHSISPLFLPEDGVLDPGEIAPFMIFFHCPDVGLHELEVTITSNSQVGDPAGLGMNVFRFDLVANVEPCPPPAAGSTKTLNPNPPCGG